MTSESFRVCMGLIVGLLLAILPWHIHAQNKYPTLSGNGEISLEIRTAILPVVSTEALNDVCASTAYCEGFVMSSGGMEVTSRRVCWSTSSDPTINDNHSVDGIGTERFSSNMVSLSPSTTYFVRTYAINSVGIAYGEEKTFTTFPR